MMRLGPVTRWLLAALLTAGVPMCCCQGRQILGLLWGGGAVHASIMESGEGHFSVGTRDVSHGSHAHEADHGDGATPCQDGSCNDEGDCDCGHANLLAASPVGPAGSVDLASPLAPPALAAFVALNTDPPFSRTVRIDAARIPRPPTALLRLHCALLV